MRGIVSRRVAGPLVRESLLARPSAGIPSRESHASPPNLCRMDQWPPTPQPMMTDHVAP